jgi:hypothetical protein
LIWTPCFCTYYAFSFSLPSSILSLFILVCDPLLLVPSLASENMIIGSIVAYSYHIILCMWLIVESIFLHLFLFAFSSPRLIYLLLYKCNRIIIGQHRICSLIVWPGKWVSCPVFSSSNQRGSIENCMPIKCWVSCPVFSNSRQFFSLLRGGIKNLMPIKCQRVSKQEVGAEDSGPALVDSSI